MAKSLVSLDLTKILEPERSIRDKIDQQGITELSESLRKLGQLQPILVRTESNFYRIEAGHRRFLAARALGWSVIDAIVLDVTDEETLHLERAHENLIRADLNPVEESKIAWDLVYEDGRGIERTAKLLCKTDTWVESRLAIAQLPEDLKSAISKNEINVSVAKALNKVQDTEARERFLKSAIEYGASASVVQRWVSDSAVGDYLENKDTMSAAGDLLSVDLQQTSMPCRVCNISHSISILRHIWICPECMGAMRELAFETQKQLGLQGAPDLD